MTYTKTVMLTCNNCHLVSFQQEDESPKHSRDCHEGHYYPDYFDPECFECLDSLEDEEYDPAREHEEIEMCAIMSNDN